MEMNIDGRKVEIHPMTHRLPSIGRDVVCITKDGKVIQGVMEETMLGSHKSLYLHDLAFNGGRDITSVYKWFYLDEFIYALEDEREPGEEGFEEITEITPEIKHYGN